MAVENSSTRIFRGINLKEKAEWEVGRCHVGVFLKIKCQNHYDELFEKTSRSVFENKRM
jgi:hypothetical protein